MEESRTAPPVLTRHGQTWHVSLASEICKYDVDTRPKTKILGYLDNYRQAGPF